MSKAQELSSCPFCGAGETVIHVNQGTWTGRGYGEPVSVEVRHWCKEEPGQPSRAIIRVGRDESSAIAAWNLRSSASSEQQAAQQDAFELTPVRLEAAAKALSESMDYPWQHMTDKGKAAMRHSVRVTLAAARASNGGKA